MAKFITQVHVVIKCKDGTRIEGTRDSEIIMTGKDHTYSLKCEITVPNFIYNSHIDHLAIGQEIDIEFADYNEVGYATITIDEIKPTPYNDSMDLIFDSRTMTRYVKIESDK